MKTSAAKVLDLLDRLFDGRSAVDKQELLRAAGAEKAGEDALEVIRGLPDGAYSHQALEARLEASVREREQSREAGMSAHSEPGWRPQSVRRHPNR